MASISFGPTNTWLFGEAQANWNEDEPPSGNFHWMLLEPDQYHVVQDDLLYLLDALNVITYRPFYEGTNQIRIKA